MLWRFDPFIIFGFVIIAMLAALLPDRDEERLPFGCFVLSVLFGLFCFAHVVIIGFKIHAL